MHIGIEIAVPTRRALGLALFLIGGVAATVPVLELESSAFACSMLGACHGPHTARV